MGWQYGGEGYYRVSLFVKVEGCPRLSAGGWGGSRESRFESQLSILPGGRYYIHWCQYPGPGF